MLCGKAPAPDAPASTEQLLTLLSHLNDEALSHEVTVFGGARMTVDALMDVVLAHEAHHKGQSWVMARRLGLRPPRSLHLD